MKKAILKYPVKEIIEMPIGAEILSIQQKHDSPWIWAMVAVKKKEKLEKRYFKVFSTETEFDSSTYPVKDHIGTIKARNGVTIWHVFELQKP